MGLRSDLSVGHTPTTRTRIHLLGPGTASSCYDPPTTRDRPIIAQRRAHPGLILHFVALDSFPHGPPHVDVDFRRFIFGDLTVQHGVDLWSSTTPNCRAFFPSGIRYGGRRRSCRSSPGVVRKLVGITPVSRSPRTKDRWSRRTRRTWSRSRRPGIVSVFGGVFAFLLVRRHSFGPHITRSTLYLRCIFSPSNPPSEIKHSAPAIVGDPDPANRLGKFTNFSAVELDFATPASFSQARKGAVVRMKIFKQHQRVGGRCWDVEIIQVRVGGRCWDVEIIQVVFFTSPGGF